MVEVERTNNDFFRSFLPVSCLMNILKWLRKIFDLPFETNICALKLLINNIFNVFYFTHNIN